MNHRDWEKERVCEIKRCLKSNIRGVYLFCNYRERRGEAFGNC